MHLSSSNEATRTAAILKHAMLAIAACALAAAISLSLQPEVGYALSTGSSSPASMQAATSSAIAPQAKKLPSYTITPKTAPLNKNLLKSDTYTAQTKQWWVMSNIMDEFEKSGGGTLTLKKGTYNMPISIQVPSNVTIVFQKGVTLKKVKSTGTSRMSPNGAMFQMISPSKSKKVGAVKKYNGTRNVTFKGAKNVVFDMAQVKAGACAIIMAQNRNMSFSGITFKNMPAHAFELDASKNVTIENCTFMNGVGGKTKEAINLDTPDTKTGGFSYKWSKMDKTPNQNVTIQNCTFKNIERGIGTHKYSQTDNGTNKMHSNIKILDNTFTGISGYEGVVVPFNWENVTIKGNSFTGKGKATRTFGIVAHSVVNAWISDNVFNNFEHTILIRRGFDASGYASPAEISLTNEQKELLKTNRYVAGTIASPDAQVTPKAYWTTNYAELYELEKVS